MAHALKLPVVRDLAATMALESIKGFGPQKFRELRNKGVTPVEVLREPSRLPLVGKLGDRFRQDLETLAGGSEEQFVNRAEKQLATAEKIEAHIVLYSDEDYPPNLWASNNPVPVLYVLGDLSMLKNGNSVACVGSREIDSPYEGLQSCFAHSAAARGWVVTSGFATGADAVAHQAAIAAQGQTIGVMPCGLDRPFPPENRNLWEECLQYPGAVMVSEFAFGTAASTLTLRKRNKTIVALSRGVLVGQSKATGGAMNAYRFAIEQKKPVATFAGDDTDRTSGNDVIRQSPLGTVFSATETDESAWTAWLASL